jgi:uncharacterized membrane protein
MNESKSNNSTPVIPPERSKALADGVFAIVMTLLVLELAVPVVMSTGGHSSLVHELLEMWPEFLFYCLSFLILGMYWLVHHILFDMIIAYDTTLVWLNIFYLMFVSLIPFSTSLFGRYAGEKVTTVIYGTNLLLIFLMGFSIWTYATTKHRLVPKDLDPDQIRGGKIMGYVYFAVLLAAIGLSFVSPLISAIIYGALVVAFISLTIAGRAELAVSVKVTSKD